MKDIQKIRIRNLKNLIDKAKSQAKLADTIGVTASVISQLATGHRPLGEKLARKIELAAGRNPLWLDQDHDQDPADRQKQRDEVQALLEASTAEELRELLDDLNQLDETQLATVAKMVKGLLPHSPK